MLDHLRTWGKCSANSLADGLISFMPPCKYYCITVGGTPHPDRQLNEGTIAQVFPTLMQQNISDVIGDLRACIHLIIVPFANPKETLPPGLCNF